MTNDEMEAYMAALPPEKRAEMVATTARQMQQVQALAVILGSACDGHDGSVVLAASADLVGMAMAQTFLSTPEETHEEREAEWLEAMRGLRNVYMTQFASALSGGESQDSESREEARDDA